MLSCVVALCACVSTATAYICRVLAIAEQLTLWFAAHKPSTEKMRLKAAVPLKCEVPVMGLHSNKNFVTTNAIETILAKPKQLPEDFR